MDLATELQGCADGSKCNQENKRQLLIKSTKLIVACAGVLGVSYWLLFTSQSTGKGKLFVNGKSIQEVNKQLHGRGMPTVDPKTSEDESNLKLEYGYAMLKSTKFKTGQFNKDDVANLGAYLASIERYLSSAPLSEYRKFYARKYFDDGVEVKYLLAGPEEAQKWAVENANSLNRDGIPTSAMAKSAQVRIAVLANVVKSFGWKVPISDN
jgi:hypothetical protein